MNSIKISKKLDNKKLKRPTVKSKVDFNRSGMQNGWQKFISNTETEKNSVGKFFLAFILFFVVFGILILQLSDLQIVNGEELLAQSKNNQIRTQTYTAYRGVIFDRNGEKIVENAPAMNLFLTIENYLNEEGELQLDSLQIVSDTLLGILGEDWKSTDTESETKYNSIAEKVLAVHSESPYFKEILIATDLNNDKAIEIKALSEELPGVYIDNGSKRYYPITTALSHLLGYTGEVSAEDLENLDYVESTDEVGKSGIEKEYDQRLKGVNGLIAWEVDAMGRTVSNDEYVLKEPVAGDNLYLTIDSELQEIVYEKIKEGVKEHDATGGAGVIQDVNTGEVLALVTYPSYDNNLFVGGISYKEYEKILKDSQNPLLNRSIAAQVPPGSTFKTLVATAALDVGEITRYTQYTSRAGYTFSSGAPFQEYHNHSYGVLNVIDAISVSSNIYFCEVIRNWNMNELVPYLEAFGIGEYTGIDLPGETPGRLPSPENKAYLANTTSPWLDEVWYPEGDSCNSVIGQGITLVTPLQMSNWMSAIANGGTLNTPHLAKRFVSEDGAEESLDYSPIRTDIASSEAISLTQEGMWSAVQGPRASIGGLRGLDFEVAAKTGTAEFGALNEKGEYEHTHAWVGGFFPYDNPQYSFSIFLEDGGESYHSVNVMKDIITSFDSW